MAQFRQQSGADRFSTHEHFSIGIPSKQQPRFRRQNRTDKPHRGVSPVAIFSITLIVGLAVTFFAFHSLFKSKEISDTNGSEFVLQRNQSYSKELKFGHGSGAIGRDSRYWDMDDRGRDQDYNEDDVLGQKTEKKYENFGVLDERSREKSEIGGRLYNEGGRAELDSYKEEYEASLENWKQVSSDEEIVLDDDYDDGIDVQDDHDDDQHDDGNDGDDIGGKLGDVNNEHGEDVKLNAKKNGSFEHSKNGSGTGNRDDKVSGMGKSSRKKRKPQHHKSDHTAVKETCVIYYVYG